MVGRCPIGVEWGVEGNECGRGRIDLFFPFFSFLIGGRYLCFLSCTYSSPLLSLFLFLACSLGLTFSPLAAFSNVPNSSAHLSPSLSFPFFLSLSSFFLFLSFPFFLFFPFFLSFPLSLSLLLCLISTLDRMAGVSCTLAAFFIAEGKEGRGREKE